MVIRLTTYLDKFALLSPAQFGFQSGLSTYMALMDMQTSISDAMNSNKYSLGVFFDISKAFDTVNHALLLNKLEYYGIRGVAKQWFVDYLSNRNKFVSLRGMTSPSLEIALGVSQESIFGPIVYLIYLNDLSRVSNKLKLNYVCDDTNAFLQNNSVDVLFDIMNSELCKIVEWFNISKLSLNADKTSYILFRTPRKKTIVQNLYVNDTPLIQTQATKFLGVIIDQHLSWKDHVALISKKISKNIGIIARIKYCLSTQNLLNLYYTLIFPYLSYCNIIWGCNYKSSLNHLYILQKRIVRIICGLHWCASTKLSFYELHLLTLENINKYQILLFMFSFHNNLLPRSLHTNIASCLKKNSDIHSHFTRSSSYYRSHYVRINIKLFSIFCTGPTLWNKLPDDLKNLNSLVAFKHLLKNALIIPPWSIEH